MGTQWQNLDNVMGDTMAEFWMAETHPEARVDVESFSREFARLVVQRELLESGRGEAATSSECHRFVQPVGLSKSVCVIAGA